VIEWDRIIETKKKKGKGKGRDRPEANQGYKDHNKTLDPQDGYHALGKRWELHI